MRELCDTVLKTFQPLREKLLASPLAAWQARSELS
jgi:hypothetical protein